MTTLKQLIWVLVLAASALAATAADNWTHTTTYSLPAGQTLRGFGRVAATREIWTGPEQAQVGVMRFGCATPTHATTLLGKFLADLGLSHDTTLTTIAGTEIPATHTASGAMYVGCLSGAEARIVYADSPAALASLVSTQPTLVRGAVAQADYPAFLDRFDRYGWGCYGMGGFESFHEWMTKVDGERTFKDPTEDVEFMIKHKFRFEHWLDPAGLDNSDGIKKNTEVEWKVKMLNDANMPYSFRLYGNAGGANWAQRRFAEYLEQPASWLMCGFVRPWLQQKSAPHISWFAPDAHRYMAVKTMELMKPYANDPLNMGWMHPHGELVHQPWYDIHDDYSPRAQYAWRTYLQKQGVSLEEAALMFTGNRLAYSDWEQVRIPEFATFEGLGGMIQDLDGTWFYRRGRLSNDQKDTNYPGLAEKWYQQPLDTGIWKEIDGLPGSDRMYDVMETKTAGDYSTMWFRRSFTMTQAQINNPDKPIYFYWFPITQSKLHSGEYARYNKVFINGKPAGEIGIWGALEVSSLLQDGNNEIAVQLFGRTWQGRAFLSTDKPAVYPYLGKERNRLFLLWQDWHMDAKYDSWVEILDGMRQVDPDRPVKFMAPIKFRADRWTKLARDWGGFGHFTGEGIWFFPWYKRYGFLYDVPGSSELAGPADSVPKMFNGFRRTFLAGLNAHDPVFLAQTYTRDPDLRKWWVDHNPILKRMGKYDISPATSPQVLLYRSTHGTTRLFSPTPYPTLGQTTREINNAWDWDIGRGTLQTLGHSYLYLDDRGLTDGKMSGFSLMMDCGNETIPESSLTALEDWVKAGGTYVTLPFSGRNTELEPDVWKISELTGCQVGSLRQIGAGSVTIKAGQSVFKSLAGKTFPDNGQSMDYIGNNHNLYSVELKPGADCEVLATYENGEAAIVRRQVGAGSVIVLGSAFWRNSEDRMGLWWPEQIETDFIADLLDGLGFAKPVCTTNDRLVWAQPYRSNNGLNAVTCLVSWHEDADSDPVVSLRLPTKPAKLVSYGVDGELELPFTYQNGIATATVHMPAKEVKVIAAAVYDAGDALSHWWSYQQKMWHQIKEPTIDFSTYTQGKWADPTLDLREGGAMITQTDPATGNAKWTPSPVSILNFFGAEPHKPIWLRKTFTIPQSWKDEGGRTFLVAGSWNGPMYEGSAKLSLNGAMLHDFVDKNYRQHDFDITNLATDGENEVIIEFKGDNFYQGVKGQLYLYHWAPPARRIDLGGTWQGTAFDYQPITVILPGKATGWDLKRQVFIPEEWRGKFRVRLYMDGERGSTDGAYINDRLVRRFHHHFDTVGDLDITNFLKFGEENTINLEPAFPRNERDPKRPQMWEFSRIELHLRPVTED